MRERPEGGQTRGVAACVLGGREGMGSHSDASNLALPQCNVAGATQRPRSPPAAALTPCTCRPPGSSRSCRGRRRCRRWGCTPRRRRCRRGCIGTAGGSVGARGRVRERGSGSRGSCAVQGTGGAAAEGRQGAAHQLSSLQGWQVPSAITPCAQAGSGRMSAPLVSSAGIAQAGSSALLDASWCWQSTHPPRQRPHPRRSSCLPRPAH